MFTPKKVGISIAISISGLAFLSNPVSAHTFNYTAGESEIFQTDFSDSSGWTLAGTGITSGQLIGTSAFGRASYSLGSVNLDLGDVFLYWSGIFPVNAGTESDRYFIGLQYADNPPVCRDSLVLVGFPPCTGTAVEVDEEAELKVEMRPIQSGNPTNTFHRIYLDPDADPNDNLLTTQVNVPNYTAGQPLDYRLGIRKVSATLYEANLSYWDGSLWRSMTRKDNSEELSLAIQNTDWVDVNRWFSPSPAPFESPVTFEAINIQFRKASSRNSAITALALTQIVPSVQVPEKSSTLALLSLVGMGGLFTRRQRKGEDSSGF